ncbi:MAG: (d)CMP kinase [Patescibacteria group bacterium]
MIISIGGAPGAGKSTIAKILAERMGLPHYSMGTLRREVAKKRGMTIEEYNKLGETDPSTDREVDEYQKQLPEKDFIIDGRMSWHFIPSSFKVYLTVDERVGAERIFSALQKSDERNEGESLTSADAVLASNRKRIKSDKKRYAKYYGKDAYDTKNYDLVIDTTHTTPEGITEKILKTAGAG